MTKLPFLRKHHPDELMVEAERCKSGIPLWRFNLARSCNQNGCHPTGFKRFGAARVSTLTSLLLHHNLDLPKIPLANLGCRAQVQEETSSFSFPHFA